MFLFSSPSRLGNYDAYAVERAVDALHCAGIDSELFGNDAHTGPPTAQGRRGLVPQSSHAPTRQIRPSSGTSPSRQVWWCRAPVGAGNRSTLSAWSSDRKPTKSCKLRLSRSTDQARHNLTCRTRLRPRAGSRLPPKVFEPVGGQLGIAHRVLDVLVAEPSL
jgi:hypothetical protein